jgi:hypothetical protein
MVLDKGNLHNAGPDGLMKAGIRPWLTDRLALSQAESAL